MFIEKYQNKARTLVTMGSGVVVLSVFYFLLPILIGWLIKEIFKCIRRYSKTQFQLQQFRGPRAYPLIGNVLDLAFRDFYDCSAAICKRWGDPVRIWRFGNPMIFISRYDYAIQLLSKSNFNGKMGDLEMIHRLPGGKGLSTTPGVHHSEKRKLLTPAFSRQVVEGSLEIFCEESIKLVHVLETYAKSGEAFDIVDHAMQCLFIMVARSDFGDTFMKNCDQSNAKAHMNAMHIIAKNFSSRILGPYLWQRNDFIYFNCTGEGKETSEAANVLNTFATRAISKRREYRRRQSIGIINGTTTEESKRNHCYLDILLDLVECGEMTDDDVVSELNNFMGGAYDTTALAVCWTLFLLALNPTHQKKVYEELREIFRFHSSTSSSRITAVETKQMKYLELCLKESLRLFPPVPIFPRSTVSEMRLNDGRVIPAGVDVLIFANLIHQDPKHFPDPAAFYPERHLECVPAFMPFSLGVRNCIGQTYAMYQSKIVLAYMLMEYEWTTSTTNKDDIKVNYQGLLYPAEGLYLKIAKRKHT